MAGGWTNEVTAAEDTAISKMHLSVSWGGIKIWTYEYTRTHCSGDKREFLQEICARHKIYARGSRTVDMDGGGVMLLQLKSTPPTPLRYAGGICHIWCDTYSVKSLPYIQLRNCMNNICRLRVVFAFCVWCSVFHREFVQDCIIRRLHTFLLTSPCRLPIVFSFLKDFCV